MKKMIRQIMALATLCWVMASCSDDTFNQEEGMGYLRLTLGKVDVELTSTTKAEAVSLPDELIPATTDFMIDIKQGNKSVEGFPKKYSDLQEGIELNAGGYTVTAYSNKNNPIQEMPYFSGSSTVQIYPGKGVTENIDVYLANAMVTPAVSKSLNNHYSEWSLTVKVGEDEIKLADKENADGYLFVQAGQSAKAIFKGKNILGNSTLHEWGIITSAIARTKYVIQCDPDIPVFSFGLNAVAVHTTDASDYLNGTKVSLSFGDLSNVPVSLITNWKATLVNATGEIVRSYSTKDFINTVETIENGWPYLPQGNYTLRYSYTIDGSEVSEEATANEAKTVTMPLPTFKAEVSAQTSYSVYTSQGATAANEKDGSGIFDIATTTTISPDILSNEKYSNLLSITYSLDSGESSTEESPTFQNLQWGTRKLTAFALFDGNNATSSVDCEVTGIPYKGDYTNHSPFDDTVNPWISVGSGEYWEKYGYLLFQYSGTISTSIKYNSYVFSPAFQVPAIVDVSYSTKVAYFTWGSASNSIEVYTGVGEKTDNSIKDKTTSIDKFFVAGGGVPDDDKFTVISDNTTIKNNYRVCISHNSNANKNWADNWLIFKSLEVLYR